MKALTYPQLKALERADLGVSLSCNAIGGPLHRELTELVSSGHLLEAKICRVTTPSPMSLMYFLTDLGAEALKSALDEK